MFVAKNPRNADLYALVPVIFDLENSHETKKIFVKKIPILLHCRFNCNSMDLVNNFTVPAGGDITPKNQISAQFWLIQVMKADEIFLPYFVSNHLLVFAKPNANLQTFSWYKVLGIPSDMVTIQDMKLSDLF